MTAIHSELAVRIRGEVPDLERLVQRVMKAWPDVGKSTDGQDVYLDSVSLNLHGFYSGLERLFELVAIRVDQVRPSGDTWHRDSLQEEWQVCVAKISPVPLIFLFELFPLLRLSDTRFISGTAAIRTWDHKMARSVRF